MQMFMPAEQSSDCRKLIRQCTVGPRLCMGSQCQLNVIFEQTEERTAAFFTGSKSSPVWVFSKVTFLPSSTKKSEDKWCFRRYSLNVYKLNVS
jgi:hypothetical protein